MMKRTSLLMLPVAALLGSTCASAEDSSVDALYVEAMECRVAAKVLQGLPRSDAPSEEERDLIAKVDAAEASYAAASRWLGSKIGKDALRVKAEFAIAMLGVASKILKEESSGMDYARTALSCSEAIQEAEA